jgi:hypothetical protein
VGAVAAASAGARAGREVAEQVAVLSVEGFRGEELDLKEREKGKNPTHQRKPRRKGRDANPTKGP